MDHDITDEHWTKITQHAIPLLLRGDGHEATTENAVGMFKAYWKLLGDEKKLDAYIEERELAEKETARAAAVIAIEVLDEEIAEIKKRKKKDPP